MHIRPLTPFSIRGTGSITMHIALSIARFFVLAITLAVCASGSNSRFTTSAPLLPHVSRIFHFRPSGPGALCSQWQKCDLKSSCAFFHGGPHYGIGVCKRVVGPGYPCGNPYFQCAPGTKCVKWKGGKRCRILLSADGVCADFSKTLCKYGLECHKGKCLHAGAYGAQCDGKHHLCRSGFICAGSGEVKTCKVLVSKGASCESAAAACEVGTACTKYHEHGLRCVAVVDHGETCGQFKACKYGLKCIDGKCVAAGLKGAKCGFGKHFCFPGLTCVQHGNHKVCEKLMKKGEDCSGQYMSCYPGLNTPTGIAHPGSLASNTVRPRFAMQLWHRTQTVTENSWRVPPVTNASVQRDIRNAEEGLEKALYATENTTIAPTASHASGKELTLNARASWEFTVTAQSLSWFARPGYIVLDPLRQKRDAQHWEQRDLNATENSTFARLGYVAITKNASSSVDEVANVIRRPSLNATQGISASEVGVIDQFRRDSIAEILVCRSSSVKPEFTV